MLITHLTSPASLPSTSGPNQLSVLTYNVLLPNSEDGWWNYKMYLPPLSQDQIHVSSWDYRRKLLKDRIRTINADIVCLQEVSPQSFESDFQFMKEELGYDGKEMFKKGRFRPATFWKKQRCDLITMPIHRDRTLLTSFTLSDVDYDNHDHDNHIHDKNNNLIHDKKNDDNNNNNQNHDKNNKSKKNNHNHDKNNNSNTIWHVLNCHLQAGNQGGRRVRQIDDGIKASFKLAKKLKEKDPTNPNLIVCGDFNGGSECGAIRYLEDGIIQPNFLEDGTSVTSKPKAIPLSKPMIDSSSELTTTIRPPPPTLVVTELIPHMIHNYSSTNDDINNDNNNINNNNNNNNNTVYDNPKLSDLIIQRLTTIYNRYATHDHHPTTTTTTTISSDNNTLHPKTNAKVMNCHDVEKWLTDINGQVGRGSEFRKAAKEMGWKEPSSTTQEEESNTTIVTQQKDDNNNDNNENKKNTKETTSPPKPPPPKPRIFLPPNGILTLEGFINVYQDELNAGKFWGIAHDLALLGEPLPTTTRHDEEGGLLFQARFDRIYHTHSIRLETILDTTSNQHCPSSTEPSDHLPVAAIFSKDISS